MFLFEFAVVLLGVLAAQAVADWADDRRLANDAEAQFRLARQQAIEVARVQKHWAAVGPCLIARAQAVAQAAARGETMAPAAIGRPALPPVQMPAWDADVRRMASARIDEAQMRAIGYAETATRIMDQTTFEIRDGWSTFALLDPAHGPVSDIDRGNVRLAATRVVDRIRSLQNGNFDPLMEALQVPPADVTPLEWGGERVDQCGLLAQW